MEIIGEGAEAKIIKIDDNVLKKIRLPKTYRLEIIDNKLRKFRNKREFKILTKLYEAKVNVPQPFELIENIRKENEEQEIAFTFKYIKGDNIKYILDKRILNFAFDEIIKIHNQNITHSDLTTLNMLYSNNKVYIIDFGLGLFSHKAEDKAVDLNIFFNCIKNEHPEFYDKKEELIKIYLEKAQNSEKIIKSLNNIEKRGRNK